MDGNDIPCDSLCKVLTSARDCDHGSLCLLLSALTIVSLAQYCLIFRLLCTLPTSIPACVTLLEILATVNYFPLELSILIFTKQIGNLHL